MLPIQITGALTGLLLQRMKPKGVDVKQFNESDDPITIRGPAVIVGRNNGPSSTNGSHTLYCTHNSIPEAEELAADVWQEVMSATPVLKEPLKIHRLDATVVAAVDSVDDRFFCVRIVVVWE